MADVLSDDEVRAALAQLTGWSGDATSIQRTVHAGSFLGGIDLVAAVARIAEELDHHPDVDIRYRDITFTLSTHSAGGVTNHDLELARRIDAAAADAGG
ncbi:MAG: 4a-hydroxytetrahydrobiopterin dehydratase [Mycobacteriales bacterium]|nr:4a-hydroxytetrahydrobiopterin dehydratase [Frankia sp.]